MNNYTQDEAKTKWCPHARELFSYNEEASYNRDAKGIPSTMCIGSGCMMWQHAEAEMQTMNFNTMGGVPEGDGWECVSSDEGRESYMIKSMWERKTPNRRGFCGLACKP